MTATPTQEPARAGELSVAFMAEVCDAAVQAMQVNGLENRAERLAQVRDQLRETARHLAAPINPDAVDSKLTGAQPAGDAVAWVAEVFPDWTTLRLVDGSAFAFNRETGKVYKVPHPDCPFVMFPTASKQEGRSDG